MGVLLNLDGAFEMMRVFYLVVSQDVPSYADQA